MEERRDSHETEDSAEEFDDEITLPIFLVIGIMLVIIILAFAIKLILVYKQRGRKGLVRRQRIRKLVLL